MQPTLRPPAVSLLAALAFTAAVAGAARAARALEAGVATAATTITAGELAAHVDVLAGPDSEGRDSPSPDLARAARYVAERFRAAGLVCAPDVTCAEVDGERALDGYLRGFQVRQARALLERSRLALLGDAPPGPEVGAFEAGRDFVPIDGAVGEAEGELVFAGFGIRAPGEGWDDLAGLDLRGKIALIVAGEPDHARRFDGREISASASLWAKLADLEEAGAAGVLVARRDARLAFRATWAQFVDGRHVPRPEQVGIVALEVARDAAERLCGTSIAELAARSESKGKPERLDLGGRRVALAGATETADLPVDNVVGWIGGGDPALAHEVVVVGAHYDHLGVDARGRIAFGADDNASGTAVLIELAEALVSAGPRRSVALCAFAAEEDGLLGSYALLDRPPVPIERMVAMLNMDMVGRGDAREVAVVGLRQNPDFERILKRAQKEVGSGVRKVVTKGGEELFKRSDHYPFHERGVPAVFFFEGLPITRNKDYHTWRDTQDQLDFDKIENTARLVFATTWLLANDDERPAPPRD